MSGGIFGCRTVEAWLASSGEQLTASSAQDRPPQPRFPAYHVGSAQAVKPRE